MPVGKHFNKEKSMHRHWKGKVPAKSIFTVFALAILALALCSSALAFQNEPGDFRGLKWESSVRDTSGMNFLAEEGDLRFYEREKDPMRIGDVPVERIVYGFFKDRFYNVLVYYLSLPNFLSLKGTLSAQYGEPYRPSETANKYFWNGEKVDILLLYDDVTNTGRISYLFKPIESQMEGSR
jgi:hypothetical protein